MVTVPYLCGEAEFDSFLKITPTEGEKNSYDICFTSIHQNERTIGVCGFHGVEPRCKLKLATGLIIITEGEGS